MTEYFQAIYDFDAENDAELTLREGDVVQVINKDVDWWEGQLADGRLGLFPANRVAPYTASTNDVEAKQQAYNQAKPGPVYQTNPVAGPAPPKSTPTSKFDSQKSTVSQQSSKAALLAPVKGPEKPVSNTKFGPWAANMVILSAPISLVLGINSVVWGLKDDNRGLKDILVGIYTIIFCLACLWYEIKGPGRRRTGDKMPWRAIVYFVASGVLYASVPTVFAGTFFLCVAGANLVAAYVGEEYEAPPPPKVMEQSKSEVAEDVSHMSCFDRVKRRIVLIRQQNQTGTLFMLFLYSVVNIIVFFVALSIWIDKNNHFPPKKRLSKWAPLAKAFGNTCDLNCSIILLPVLRTMIRGLYSLSTGDERCCTRCMRWVLKFVPLDEALSFHKLIAKVMAIQSIGHTVMHLINYINAPDPTINKFGVWPWISGGIIFVCMLLMYGAAMDTVKRGHFEIFWYSHHLFIPFFVFTLLHGGPGYNPNFWKWFIGPGILYIIERLLRVYRARQPVVVLSVTHMKPQVFSFEIAKEGVFAKPYAEGQYVFLCCPAVSTIQWHPFTISSAPQEKTVTFHIKTMGPGSWTEDLANYMGAMGAANSTYYELTRQTDRGLIPGKLTGPDGSPMFQIDGPHSAPTQHVSEFNTVMVIGSGIGVTPVAATLKSVVLHKWKYYMGHCFPDNAYFFWVCAHNDIDSFRWLIRAIKDCEDEIYDMRAKNAKDMNQKRFEFHIFVTSVPHGQKPVDVVVDDDIGYWGVPKEDRHLEKIRCPFNEIDIYKNMLCPPDHAVLGDVHIWKGRPKWDDRFSAVAMAHPKGEIGALFCGNPIIGNDLNDMCSKYSSVEQERYFRLHKENF